MVPKLETEIDEKLPSATEILLLVLLIISIEGYNVLDPLLVVVAAKKYNDTVLPLFDQTAALLAPRL